jgi:hypothetical protein
MQILVFNRNKHHQDYHIKHKSGNDFFTFGISHYFFFDSLISCQQAINGFECLFLSFKDGISFLKVITKMCFWGSILHVYITIFFHFCLKGENALRFPAHTCCDRKKEVGY